MSELNRYRTEGNRKQARCVQKDMNEIEYVFGTGDGTVHIWSTEADLELARSGIADALQLDFDGDGLTDDALWDSHGTGIADVSALDLDDDGVLDHFYTDPSGLGTWNHLVTGAASDAGSEQLAWIERSGAEEELGTASQHVLDQGLGNEESDSGAPLEHPTAWSDPLAPFDQVGALHDQRAAAGDHVTEQLNVDDGTR
ncbi:hypothetical protein ACLMAJ_26345 [Nocardia sp. KC 131]|uniref:hypothetical protein n=1 Tax=Nocardia arseniciresistens TaxID=3392119 RepID=UPI00398F0FBF